MLTTTERDTSTAELRTAGASPRDHDRGMDALDVTWRSELGVAVLGLVLGLLVAFAFLA